MTSDHSKMGKRAPVMLSLAFLMAGCIAETPVAPKQQNVAARMAPQMRTYYIAADEVEWDYAPTGINQITGQPFDDVANVFVQNGPDRIGKVYLKARYREYTDATFTELKPIPPEWEHLGILGPLVRAVVGDSIDFVFRNNTSLPFTVHAHGMQYLKDGEGAPSNDGTGPEDHGDDSVAPGTRTPTTGSCRIVPARARWTAAPCAGCTTRTSSSRVTRIRA